MFEVGNEKSIDAEPDWRIAAVWIGGLYIHCAVAVADFAAASSTLGAGVLAGFFSVALGFIGLAMMVLQFALTARIRTIEAAYGD